MFIMPLSAEDQPPTANAEQETPQGEHGVGDHHLASRGRLELFHGLHFLRWRKHRAPPRAREAYRGAFCLIRWQSRHVAERYRPEPSENLWRGVRAPADSGSAMLSAVTVSGARRSTSETGHSAGRAPIGVGARALFD